MLKPILLTEPAPPIEEIKCMTGYTRRKYALYGLAVFQVLLLWFLSRV